MLPLVLAAGPSPSMVNGGTVLTGARDVNPAAADDV